MARSYALKIAGSPTVERDELRRLVEDVGVEELFNAIEDVTGIPYADECSRLAHLLANKINWALLTEQKGTLVDLRAATASSNTYPHLTGIIHLIDALEDANRGIVRDEVAP